MNDDLTWTEIDDARYRITCFQALIEAIPRDVELRVLS